MTADPVRIPNLFGTVVEPPFVRASELADLAADVISTCDEFEPIATALRETGLVIEYVWETKPFDPLIDEYKPHVIAKVTKASPLWLSLASIHLVVQFRYWFWERFDETQRRAVIHHELTHITLEEPDAQGRLPIKLRPHDVEDFNQTMRRFGPVIPGRTAFVKAYLAWGKEHPDGHAGIADTRPESPTEFLDRVMDKVADQVNAGALDHDGVTATMARIEGGRRVDVTTGEILGSAECERLVDRGDCVTHDATWPEVAKVCWGVVPPPRKRGTS